MPFDPAALEARLSAPLPDLSALGAQEQFDLIASKAAAGESIVTRAGLLERLRESKAKGRPLRFKLGIDATTASIHIGHAIPLINLRRILKMGHHLDLIFGDFTAMVGDAAGRMEERPALSAEQVRANVATYAAQAGRVLDLNAPGVSVHYNSAWLGKLTLSDWLKVTKGVGVSALLQREDFRKRMEAGLPLSLAEAEYALLMGYDSVTLKSDVEVGGMDQFLNFHFCRNLMEAAGQAPESFVCFDMLPGTTGERDEQGRLKKMSKTGGNHIALASPAEDHYGKVLSVPDEVMWIWYRELTEITAEELGGLKQAVASGALHPKEAKRLLARLVVALFNGHDQAVVRQAEAAFDQKFGAAKVLVPEDTKAVALAGPKVLDALRSATGESANQLRRLAQQKGLQILEGGEYLPLAEERLAEESGFLAGRVLKIGKRQYFKFN
ncbi:MAG TPA: tyrosine--tRNA ligase [bacterium]|nr:tyrosine--tRNA ligase [bacterium]